MVRKKLSCVFAALLIVFILLTGCADNSMDTQTYDQKAIIQYFLNNFDKFEEAYTVLDENVEDVFNIGIDEFNEPNIIKYSIEDGGRDAVLAEDETLFGSRVFPELLTAGVGGGTITYLRNNGEGNKILCFEVWGSGSFGILYTDGDAGMYTDPIDGYENWYYFNYPTV